MRPARGWRPVHIPPGSRCFCGEQEKNFFSANWMQSGCNERNAGKHHHCNREQFASLMRCLDGAQGRKLSFLIFQWVAFPTLRQTFHCFL
jgi:hypothetical protein